MKYTYFPGCAGHATARDQDESTRVLFETLGVELAELSDWNCCGATPGHTVGGDLGLLLCLKNLGIAADTEYDLLVPCASCYGNLKSAAHAVATHRVPLTLLEGTNIEMPRKQVEVLSIISVLSATELLGKIEKSTTVDLSSFNLAPYYGCLLLRPEDRTGATNAENPRDMERVISACGAQSIEWPYKTDCCGGPNTVGHPETVTALSSNLVNKARQFGADAIVTACPMCHASLESAQWETLKKSGGSHETPLPVFYLSEIVATAMGIKRQRRWLKRHLIDPCPLLKSKGVLK